MADFCKQCSMDHFGEDFNDLRGLTSQEEWDKGLAVNTICEGCGFIQVDPDGNCVSPDCDECGKVGHGLPWKVMVSGEAEKGKEGETSSDVGEGD